MIVYLRNKEFEDLAPSHAAQCLGVLAEDVRSEGVAMAATGG